MHCLFVETTPECRKPTKTRYRFVLFLFFFFHSPTKEYDEISQPGKMGSERLVGAFGQAGHPAQHNLTALVWGKASSVRVCTAATAPNETQRRAGVERKRICARTASHTRQNTAAVVGE